MYDDKQSLLGGDSGDSLLHLVFVPLCSRFYKIKGSLSESMCYLYLGGWINGATTNKGMIYCTLVDWLGIVGYFE